MKKLRDWFGGSKSSAEPQAQAVDPRKLLFSLSTIAADDIALEPMTGPPGDADLIFHEDDWRQIEFFAKARQEEIAHALISLKAFEARNRVAAGYRDIFQRKLAALPVFADPLEALEKTLGVTAGPGPVLFHGSGTIDGRVKNGFSLPLAGKAWLYGMRDLTVLGAAMPPGADNEVLARTFMALNQSYGLVLVDWRSQMLLLKVADDGNLEVWRP